MPEHPFLKKDFYIRWSQLTADHIEVDITLALERAQERIDSIKRVDAADATFENTFLALEDSTEELNRSWGIVSHLSAVNDSKPLRDAHNAMLPKVSEFYSRIPLDSELWSVLKAFAAKPEAEKLEGIHCRLFQETMADFRQHGADLPADKKQRLEEVQSELAKLTQKYSENTLDSTNAWELIIDEEEKLRGLPESAIAAALESAKSKDLGTEEKPVWRFTQHEPSFRPVMIYLEDDSLRRKTWEGAQAIGTDEPYDNSGLIRRIVELRAERANILDKKHFADLVLERRMARTGKTAYDFVTGMHAKIRDSFAAECRELEEYKAQKTGEPAGPLEPWQLGYWSEKLRREKYDFDEEKLRPYFPIDRVVGGLFEVLKKLFGVQIREHEGDAEVWNPDVKIYDVHDKSGEKHLGSFYADWHPRESKRSGAWMNYLITGGPQPDGSRLPHLGLMCGNLIAGSEGKPALLSHREVQTIFHEAGHLFHHLLGEVSVRSLNGVNVAWDFVELPSQILENWIWDREGLDLFARHYKTGETIPDELFDRMIAARNFHAAIIAVRQLSFGLMDLEMHMNPDRVLKSDDLEAELRDLLADYVVPTKTRAPSIVRRFGHLFSDPVGYAAGYYSYKWAEVLDADAFTRFQKEGIFNEKTGADFRDKILSRGNSEDPMELYKSFMGREPDPTALLVRSGLA